MDEDEIIDTRTKTVVATIVRIAKILLNATVAIVLKLTASKKVMERNLLDDKISNLPDDMLCHILSFLPTKYSVRTSVLSTRWKSLFTFVPNRTFKYPNEKRSPPATSFVEFVNSVFLSYNVSSMNKFELTYYNFHEPHIRCPVFSWILSVIRCNVQQIKICIDLGAPRALPLSLFSCKSLTNLTLFGEFKFKLPPSVSLPCLISCYLEHVRFYDDSARRLFPSCPMLESLALMDCHFGEGGNILDVSSPTLKHFSFCVSANELEDGFKLVVYAPNLVYFRYIGRAVNEFFGIETLKSVVKAFVCCEPDANELNTDVVVVKFVRAMCHVQELILSCGPIKAFLRTGHSWPTFRNLTTLFVGPISNLSRFLLDLLDKLPQLEYLNFNWGKEEDADGADQNSWVLPEHVPLCVSRHLKEVNFIYFAGLDSVLKLIKYFLKYAKVLRKMKIRTNESWDEQFEISSEACEIVFYMDKEMDEEMDEEM